MRDSWLGLALLTVLASPAGTQETQEIQVVGVAKESVVTVGAEPRLILRVAAGVAGNFSDISNAAVLRPAGATFRLLGVDEKLRFGAGDILYIPSRSGFRATPPNIHEVLVALHASKPDAATDARIWSHLAEAIRTARTSRHKVLNRLFLLERHPEPGTRIRQVQALGTLGEDVALAVPGLIAALEQGGRVTDEAITALGVLGPAARRAIPRLRELTKHESKQTSRRATAALLAIAKGGKPQPAKERAGGRGARELEAQKFSDMATLKWHYGNVMIYRNRQRRLPPGTGHEFVLAPWVDGIVQHTTTNRDRFFSGTLAASDHHYLALLGRSPRDLWKTRDDISARDTHFAGPSTAGRKLSKDAALMAGPVYPDGTVAVLYGDGTIRQLRLEPEERGTWIVAEIGLKR